MNTRILLLAGAVAALSSCTSAYKTGQTPDDVYYSPARVQAAAAKVNEDEQSYLPSSKSGTSTYQSYDQYMESQRDNNFLRMSVGNPYYMNYYNSYSGFDWRYNAYYDGYNYGAYSPWNNYFAWNSFYNPYCAMPYAYVGYGMGSYYYGGGGYYVAGGKYATYTTLAPISRPRVFNMNSYSPTNATGRSYTPSTYYNNGQRYNNSNNNSNSGNRVYYNNGNSTNARSMYPANSGTNNNSYSPSRSYTPSSGGGGGASSGGGGISRPGRGN